MSLSLDTVSGLTELPPTLTRIWPERASPPSMVFLIFLRSPREAIYGFRLEVEREREREGEHSTLSSNDNNRCCRGDRIGGGLNIDVIMDTSSGPSRSSSAVESKSTQLSTPSLANTGVNELKAPSRHKTEPAGKTRSTGVSLENGHDGAKSVDAYAGTSIFHRSDRPTVMPQHSFVIGGGKSAPRASSFDNRLSFKSIGENLPRIPTLSSIPSMPSMPEMPNIPFMRRRESARKGDSLPRANSESIPEGARADELERTTISKEDQKQAHAVPLKQRIIDVHARHPNLKDMSKPLLPIAVFPNQGTGKSSEFNQEAPIWSRQPFKLLYLAYFGLSIGLVFLPWFAISSLFRSQRARPSWDWKRSTLVMLYRHGARLTFRTYTSLSRDLSKEVPHSKTVRAKFVWVAGLPDELIKGHVRKAMKIQELKSTRTCGFWYGERDGGGGVGQRANAGEKVIYHLHGGAYWIGTAHEKDVTSAVNMEALRALDVIYSSRMPHSEHGETNGFQEPPNRSPHPPAGGPATTKKHSSGGHCKRTFSLDYRLCVPGHPEMGSYPAALLDSLAGYRYLVEECGFACENIIVAGDSAGGNLALAMCRYLRDEKLYKMPGAMLLLSPWADASRSHSGPSGSPNKFSTTYTNGHCDIISPSIAFRNTAVSALLGKLPAGETYRNPYISSISLQLPTDKGGSGPEWGFEGFPRRIYICTGSAEISYDQHLTLAYRLAGGTATGRPIHSGDQLSINADAFEMAARLSYPRPQDCEITLWPSAQNVPAGTPLYPPAEWGGDGEARFTSHVEQGEKASNHLPETAKEYPFQNLPLSDGDMPIKALGSTNGDIAGDQSQVPQATAPSTDAAAANDTAFEAGKGPNSSQVKEKDTENAAEVTHEHNRQEQFSPTDEVNNKGANGHDIDLKMNGTAGDQPSNNSSSHRLLEPSYFGLGREDRTVILDECKDAVHDYTLFNWYEPERGQTWARIAKWIDEEV